MTRVFFDIDGVLAEYKETELAELYKEGYFKNLKPYEESLKAIRELSEDPQLEICTLSAYLSDSSFALDEKKFWVNKYFSENNIKSIFLPCGESKAKAVPGGIRENDILIDDYNLNLNDWSRHGIAIKFLNGINHRHGSWKGAVAENNAEDIKKAVYSAISA